MLQVVDHPLVQDALVILRDKETPSDLFRATAKRLAILLAVRAFDHLPLETRQVQTPLCMTEVRQLPALGPALVSILRAGNGMLEGMLECCPKAAVGFIGLERDEKTFEPQSYYCKLPGQLEKRKVVVLDPMLATGGSAVEAVNKIKRAGAQHIRFVCLLAAPEGVKALQDAHADIDIITAALDSHLNECAYIVPGLGDAGDRIFGTF